MNGIINVIKPPGMSSSGVVVFLKGILKQKKIGHAGTLDPGAAGVLPVLVGRSTRLSDLLMSCGKEYIAEVYFGIATDTLDSYGEITELNDCHISEEQFIDALNSIRGVMYQRPPAYSAVKINGVPSYKLARNGNSSRKPERKITVYDCNYISKVSENRFLFRVRCSKGTYVRVITEHLGKLLGVPAHMSFLLRTESGGLRIENSYTVDEIKLMFQNNNSDFLLSPDFVDFGYKHINISEDDMYKLKNGLIMSIDGQVDSNVFIYSDNVFLGIGEVFNGKLKLKISLYD